MTADRFTLRLRVLALLIGLMFAVFVARLWYMQLSTWYQYVHRTALNRTDEIRSELPRGLIFDRSGVRLAENERTFEVQTVPAELPTDDRELADLVLVLAQILGASTLDVQAALTQARQCPVLEPTVLPKIGENVPLRPCIAEICERRLELPGIYIRRAAARRYPAYTPDPSSLPPRQIASHVLGHAKAITAEQYAKWRDLEVKPAWRHHNVRPRSSELSEQHEGLWAKLGSSYQLRPAPKVYSAHSIVGQDGVEALCDPDLTGEIVPPLPREPVLMGLPGQSVIEVDARRRNLRVRYREEGRPGANVYLTISAPIQYATEVALAKAVRAHSQDQTGAAVLMDVNTGEILALASEPPAPDPNILVRGATPEQVRQWQNDERSPWTDKAIAGHYALGSVFKIVSGAAALEKKELRLSDTFHCDGVIYVGDARTPFHCWKRKGHGTVDYLSAMAQSCNVFFYELVRKRGLSSEEIAQMAAEFGFGEATGVGLPGENPGLVPTPEEQAESKDQPWYEGDTLHLAIGGQRLDVTPLQVAVAVAAVANGGKLLRPQVIKKIVWPASDGRVVIAHPEVRRQLRVSPHTLDCIRRGMYLAVNSKIGTAYKHISVPGVVVAGKTGSAEVDRVHKPHAWFACFAPYKNPRYACVVLITRGGYGGQVAAPVAEVMLREAFRRLGPPVPSTSSAEPSN